MPVFEFECSSRHLTGVFYHPTEHHPRSIKCSCGKQAKRLISRVSFRWAQGQSPTEREQQRRVRAYQETDDFQQKVRDEVLVPDDSKYDPVEDSPLASSDSTTAIMAAYESSASAVAAEDDRIDSLVDGV